MLHVMGLIAVQFAPGGQQRADDDESRDMQVSVGEQQKLLGRFESIEVQELKVEFAQVESRCCNTPKACAAETATLRADEDGTMLDARHMRPSF
jgi:hypothetical protein